MPYSSSRLRRAMIWWLYAVALGHLVVSLFLAWGGHTAPAEAYLARVEAVFWPDTVPTHTRELQQWWLSLFGATLQSYSVFMLVLVHLGNTLRAPLAWLGMMAGVLLWAPQDMYFSVSSGMTVNAWIDAGALLVLLVPLAWLYRHDRSQARAQVAAATLTPAQVSTSTSTPAQASAERRTQARPDAPGTDA